MCTSKRDYLHSDSLKLIVEYQKESERVGRRLRFVGKIITLAPTGLFIWLLWHFGIDFFKSYQNIGIFISVAASLLIAAKSYMNEGAAHAFRCGQIEDLIFLFKYFNENALPSESLVDNFHKLKRDPELIKLINNCIEPAIIEKISGNVFKKS